MQDENIPDLFHERLWKLSMCEDVLEILDTIIFGLQCIHEHANVCRPRLSPKKCTDR